MEQHSTETCGLQPGLMVRAACHGCYLPDCGTPDGASIKTPCQAGSVITVAVCEEVLLAAGAGESKAIHDEPCP